MIMGCHTGSLGGPSFQVSRGIFSWFNGLGCGWASKMMDTLTVKDKGLRALFLWALTWQSLGAAAGRAISYIKIERSQARKLALYIKISRSQARKRAPRTLDNRKKVGLLIPGASC